MSYYRMAEHRRLRAELIRRWKPWKRSTGPRTEEVKATSSRNGYKGGERQRLRAPAKLLRRTVCQFGCNARATTRPHISANSSGKMTRDDRWPAPERVRYARFVSPQSIAVERAVSGIRQRPGAARYRR